MTLARTRDTVKAARNHERHDLVRSGTDALHPRITVEARNRVLVHIAIAAEQLQAAIDDFSTVSVTQDFAGSGRDDAGMGRRAKASKPALLSAQLIAAS
jgi:hypothetical protein